MMDAQAQAEIDRLAARPGLTRVYRKTGEGLEEPTAAFAFRYRDDDGRMHDAVVCVEFGGRD